jgi:hypothetical protein
MIDRYETFPPSTVALPAFLRDYAAAVEQRCEALCKQLAVAEDFAATLLGQPQSRDVSGGCGGRLGSNDLLVTRRR